MRSSNDDCELVGTDYILVPEGEYEIYFISWETSSRFSRKDSKDPSKIKGGKLYLWFEIDPYNNQGEKKLVFMALNVEAVLLPIGKKGKFRVGKRSKYYSIFKRLFGEKAASYAKSPKFLEKTLFKGRVRTVTRDEKQKAYEVSEQYPVIDDIISLA